MHCCIAVDLLSITLHKRRPRAICNRDELCKTPRNFSDNQLLDIVQRTGVLSLSIGIGVPRKKMKNAVPFLAYGQRTDKYRQNITRGVSDGEMYENSKKIRMDQRSLHSWFDVNRFTVHKNIREKNDFFTFSFPVTSTF